MKSSPDSATPHFKHDYCIYGLSPSIILLGLSCTCYKIGRNDDHGSVSSNFINRVFLLSNFWYSCSTSPSFFIPCRFNSSFCSPYTFISRATCSIFRGALFINHSDSCVFILLVIYLYFKLKC